MIHLLSNGHSRCGTPPGRLSYKDWPTDTGITSTPSVATCPTCRGAASLPPIGVSPAVVHVVEMTKKGIAEMTGSARTEMDLITVLLLRGTTIGELATLLQKLIPRPSAQTGEA